MTIRIRWERRAVKEVAQLPKPDRKRIVAAIEGLRGDPTKGSILSADWKGFRRLRVGPYRVIYAYQGRDLLVSVVRVGHRREVDRRQALVRGHHTPERANPDHFVSSIPGRGGGAL